MELKFTSYAWEDYKYWEKQDSRTLKKINALIEGVSVLCIAQLRFHY